MRAREPELHPLCCLPAQPPPAVKEPPPSWFAIDKWTNIGKGFAIRGAVLAYFKVRRRSRTIGFGPIKVLTADDTVNISKPRPNLVEAEYCSGHGKCSGCIVNPRNGI